MAPGLSDVVQESGNRDGEGVLWVTSKVGVEGNNYALRICVHESIECPEVAQTVRKWQGSAGKKLLSEV